MAAQGRLYTLSPSRRRRPGPHLYSTLLSPSPLFWGFLGPCVREDKFEVPSLFPSLCHILPHVPNYRRQWSGQGILRDHPLLPDPNVLSFPLSLFPASLSLHPLSLLTSQRPQGSKEDKLKTQVPQAAQELICTPFLRTAPSPTATLSSSLFSLLPICRLPLSPCWGEGSCVDL